MRSERLNPTADPYRYRAFGNATRLIKTLDWAIRSEDDVEKVCTGIVSDMLCGAKFMI